MMFYYFTYTFLLIAYRLICKYWVFLTSQLLKKKKKILLVVFLGNNKQCNNISAVVAAASSYGQWGCCRGAKICLVLIIQA